MMRVMMMIKKKKVMMTTKKKEEGEEEGAVKMCCDVEGRGLHEPGLTEEWGLTTSVQLVGF